MNDAVAHAQAQSAGQADEQTKEQPMAESAPVVSASDDTPATQSAPAEPAVRFSAAPAPSVEYNVAQYTPSAQEAASGASSASRRLSKSQQQAAAEPPAEPLATKPAKKSRKDRKVAATSSRQAEQVSSQNAVPVLPPPPPQLEISASSSALPAPAATVTDEQLMERNLPPLRGPYTRVQREPRVLTPRDEVEMQLHSIESGFSAWLGGTGIVNTRSGDLGYSRLTALEAPFEASMPLGTSARFTVVAKPVFLDSGQADGSSLIQLSTLGRKNLGAQVQPMGTLMTTDTNPPPQQNATGIGGEAQLRFPHLALAVGYTPAGFLVATITGRVQWKPENGPFTFNFSRDPVKETQLSYAGLRDPGSTSLGYSGDIWGGVVANLGGVQYARGDEQSGFYVGAGGGSLNGYHVEPNTRIDGNGGAYWRVRTLPEYGNLNIGANFFAMHYAHNESAFTYGMGGYFSPQVYFLANVPVTWSGHSGTRWHYNILGSFGLQAFQEDLTALFPAFTGIENVKTITVDSTTYTDLALPAKTSVGANYDLRTQVAYRIGPHWFAGGFFGANNARDYSAISLGFSVRYLFREQPSKVAGPTGIFPSDGLRPFLVP
jgi:hypothetical protein